MRTSTRLWGMSLLAALGLTAVACKGSQPAGADEDGGAPGNGDGGRAAGDGEGGGAGQVASTPSTECLSPELDSASGIERCQTENGSSYSHRKHVGMGCHYEPPEGAGGAAGQGQGGAGGQSVPSDAGGERGFGVGECDAAACPGLYPYCEASVFDMERCAEGCLTDDDCPAGNVCSCPVVRLPGEDRPGQCVVATCVTDADCAPGLSCVVEYDDCPSGFESESLTFRCQTPRDQCLVAADCAEQGAICTYVSDLSRRICYVPEGVCGRPLLIDGKPRLATATPRPDWAAPTDPMPDVARLTTDERRLLAEHYTQMGLMEHASIAAFARFSLQLLSLGAPPRLVEACTTAIADETRHTRLCFELASHYAGTKLGPTALAIDGCLESAELERILELVIAEGCVGETVAALEAAEAAAQALDPALQQVLRRIADDERRHAELAFHFVGWALTQRPALADLVERVFSGCTQTPENVAVAETSGWSQRVLAHGLLSRRQRAELRDGALRDVVRPCAGALLAVSRTAAATGRSLSPALARR